MRVRACARVCVCVCVCRALYQACLSRVSSLSPAELAKYIEENARIHTEKPFEYEEDDEAKFRCAGRARAELEGGVQMQVRVPRAGEMAWAMCGKEGVCMCACDACV